MGAGNMQHLQRLPFNAYNNNNNNNNKQPQQCANNGAIVVAVSLAKPPHAQQSVSTLINQQQNTVSHMLPTTITTNMHRYRASNNNCWHEALLQLMRSYT